MISLNFVRRVLRFQNKAIFYKITNKSYNFCRHCSIRRALFHVPGDNLGKLQKALNYKVDCIVMDCEDCVAQKKKTEARETIRQMLDKEPVSKENPEWSIRINPVQTPELCEADINTLLSAKSLPASICLPKVNNIDQLQWFAEKVWNVLIQRPENNRGPLKLIMYIESPVAMMTLPDICKKAEDLSTMAPLVPVALVVGNDGLLAGLGVSRTKSGIEIFYARQKLVLVAKAFGLQAIDMAFLDFDDSKGFEQSCEEGAMFGFTGKQVMHPDQIVICQSVFVPSRSKIKWAEHIIKCYENFQKKELGAFTFKNQMIDISTVRQAENVLKVARSVGKLSKN